MREKERILLYFTSLPGMPFIFWKTPTHPSRPSTQHSVFNIGMMIMMVMVVVVVIIAVLVTEGLPCARPCCQHFTYIVSFNLTR